MSSLLPSAGAADAGIDPERWSQHTMWWSERSRCRGLLWPAGATWFANDPLGMRPHTHPDASEIYLVVSGTMQVTVGRDPLLLGPGDYCLIPPSTYHLPVNVGDDDLCLWVVIAPNWRGVRWKADGFVDADFSGSSAVVSTARAGALPSDEHLRAEVLELAPGQGPGVTELPAVERALYVLEGSVDVTIERLSGHVGAHEFVNVMAGAAHTVQAGPGGARILSVECHDPQGAVEVYED